MARYSSRAGSWTEYAATVVAREVADLLRLWRRPSSFDITKDQSIGWTIGNNVVEAGLMETSLRAWVEDLGEVVRDEIQRLGVPYGFKEPSMPKPPPGMEVVADSSVATSYPVAGSKDANVVTIRAILYKNDLVHKLVVFYSPMVRLA